MTLSSTKTGLPELSEQKLIGKICSSVNALEAHRLFEKNAAELREWQIVFAEESDVGSLKLLNLALGESGIATTVFRGKSLWLMDASFVTNSGPMQFKGGSAMFVDSNAASYIRSIAYRDAPSVSALGFASLINQIGSKLQNLNPYLYLWESLRSWNDETIAKCTQSVAAIHALASSGSKLSVEWGKRFRAEFKDSAERVAAGIIKEFQRDREVGRFSGLEDQLDLMEAILIRTKIIEMSYRKDPEFKLTQLVKYMHEELCTLALRELIICGDMLFRSGRSRISLKLNSIQNHANPFALIRNCAWDMYIPRVLDRLSSATSDQAPNVDFYLAEVLSFDGDVSDIVNTTKLKAIAIHRPSGFNLPFFDNEIAEWLGNRMGPKRMDALSTYFDDEAFEDRARRRPSLSIQSMLQKEREKLMQLIQRKKSIASNPA